MVRHIVALAAVSLMLAACGKPVVAAYPIAEQDAPIGKLPAVAHPVSYEVGLKIDPREATFTGAVTMEVWLDEPADGLWIHGDDIRVSDVTVEGQAATYEEVLPTGVSRITFRKALPAGQVRVIIAYEADFDENLAGLFRVEEQGEAYALAKSESIQARRFLPSFDEPGYKAPFDITLIVPAGNEAISNTPIISRTPYREDKAFEQVTFDTTRPLSTYLLSVAVGPFDVVEYADIPANAIRATPIPLRGIARKGRGGDLAPALDITADMVAAFEEAVQLPYPYKKLDIIAAPQWPSGATELAGAITYRESRLLLDENSGPSAYLSMLGIHSHEIAHMWFGNLVTPPWWDDLWLKEAFATWGTPLALTALEPDAGHEVDATARAIGAMRLDSLASTRAVREPIDRNEDIRNAYDGITYSKGMAVISMADAYFGPAVFRPALGEYLKAFEDEAADSPDFYRVIGEATGEADMTEVFENFIEYKGVPLVSAEVYCEEAEKIEPVVTLRQSRYRPLGSSIEPGRQWAIPVCVGYGDAGGKRGRACTIMRNEEEAISLGTQGACPAFVLPNDGGAGYFRWTLGEADWNGLVENFSELTASEGLSAVDSAAAVFEAGEGSAETLIAVMEAAAAHPDRRVAVSPMRILSRYAGILEGDAAGDLRALASDLYKPVYDEIGTPEGDDEAVLKSTTESFLALTAQDQDVRDDLRVAAGRFIGLDGPRQSRALSSDQYEAAMIVGVQDGGAAFFDRLLAANDEIDDPAFSGTVPNALGSVVAADLAARARGLALDSSLGPRERYSVIQRQMENPETREATWRWLKSNYAGFVEKIPAQWPRQTPGLASRFCDASRVTELEALFVTNGELAPGHERSLAQTSEAITLCAALKTQRSGDLATALAAR